MASKKKPLNTPSPTKQSRGPTVRMKPGDGAKIRKDDRRMKREKVYAKWAKPNGLYEPEQVSAALAWNSGKLAGLARD